MANTLVFKDKAAFDNRLNKKLNGVPKWLVDSYKSCNKEYRLNRKPLVNIEEALFTNSNVGCWNTEYSYRCRYASGVFSINGLDVSKGPLANSRWSSIP